MPAGLEIYNSSGTLVSSTTHRWGRYLGSIIVPKPTSNTATWEGYISHPNLASGEHFYYMNGMQDSFIYYPYIHYVNPTTMRWKYEFPENIGGTVMYDARALGDVLIRYGVR